MAVKDEVHVRSAEQVSIKTSAPAQAPQGDSSNNSALIDGLSCTVTAALDDC